MADFNIAYEQVLLPMEGPWCNDKGDKGKETIFGISRFYHPTWSGWAIVDAMKKRPGFPKTANESEDLKKMARQLSKIVYWDFFGLDGVKSQLVASELLEQGFNRGTAKVARELQRVLNVLNMTYEPGRCLYEDLAVDGRIGPVTVNAINVVVSRSLAGYVNAGELVLYKYLSSFQGVGYIESAENREENERFTWGWALQRL